MDEHGAAHYTFDRSIVPAALRAQLDAPRTSLATVTRAPPSLAPTSAVAPTAPMPTAEVEPRASQPVALPSETAESPTPAVSAAASDPFTPVFDPVSEPQTEPGFDPHLDGDAVLDRPGLDITSSFETDEIDEWSDDTPEMRELREQIREDREEIKRLISDGAASVILPDPRLREVAERLARREAELRALGRGAKP